MNNNLIVDKLLMYTIEYATVPHMWIAVRCLYEYWYGWNKRDSKLLVFNAIGCKYCLNGFLYTILWVYVPGTCNFRLTAKVTMYIYVYNLDNTDLYAIDFKISIFLSFDKRFMVSICLYTDFVW